MPNITVTDKRKKAVSKKSYSLPMIWMLSKKLLKELKNNWRKEEWWRFRLPSLIVRVLYRLFKRKNNGIYVMKEDWDNLIILDACSYELFADTNWIKGSLEKKISRGSHTWMFLQENFQSYYPDAVYISSNPFIWEFKDCFFRTIYVALEDEIKTYGTILPESVLKEALKANKAYPDKRLIVHFLQPHEPYIGETKIRQNQKNNMSPFHLFAKGDIDENTLRKAYKDNLKAVLPAVEKLVNQLAGKTVISSDHGEAFGAWAKPFPVRIYGHSGPRIKELIEIPWFTIDKPPRKSINTSGEPQALEINDENKIKKHLQALGYI
jgi:hypothetical protein